MKSRAAGVATSLIFIQTAENFLSANPHFCKSALARYTPADFISLVEKHGIAYHEKKLGQLFCDGSSQQIIDMLLRECLDAGVETRCSCQVLGVQKEDSFSVETNQGSFVSSSLVIATGGLSIAPLGATDFGYRIARQFGLRIEEPRPGLVPLTLTSQMLKQLTKLSGVSLDALVRCGGQEFRENILITHRGLSGPAILQISSYWQPGTPISINLLPDDDVLDILTSQDTAQGSEIELAKSSFASLAEALCPGLVRTIRSVQAAQAVRQPRASGHCSKAS